MQLTELDVLLTETLDITDFSRIDASLNGLQVERADAEVKRIACAVDACMETFVRAAAWKADVLIVHHGLFWGPSLAVRRSHYARIRFLMEHDIALYAVHLPLDTHASLGNNAGIARKLELDDVTPFGEYKGVRIGMKGRLPVNLSMDEVISKLEFDRDTCTAILPFGCNTVSTVGIVSGGGTHEIDQAVDERLDLYITGDASHTMYHYCLEESINLLCGGHYQTETFGVRSVADFLERETDLESTFIDVPTGL